MSSFVGWMNEKNLAIHLGISRAWLRQARFHVPGGHEVFRRCGKTMFWSPAGVNTLRSMVHGEALLAPVTEKTPAAAVQVPPPTERFTVLKLVPNRHLLLASDALGSTVRVRVRDNTNFMPEMVIQVRLIQGDLYELVGRGPRYRGRW